MPESTVRSFIGNDRSNPITGTSGDNLTVAITRSMADTASAAGPNTLRRLWAWMRYRRSMADLAGADARPCRDLGVPPLAQDELLRTFRVDPVPLWNIGQTPTPHADDTAPGRRLPRTSA